ncbi:DUF3160 domain-containing protein [Vallitalea guaymasensis]|uniref:DUF3160 domain-containing protein n=1 Tax=Vallitalea guaymasensis TaxID=1185412 RepID=UPI0023559873|nr:DUF3160 domain-containing protein [Vallitalea guaymasensis]
MKYKNIIFRCIGISMIIVVLLSGCKNKPEEVAKSDITEDETTNPSDKNKTDDNDSNLQAESTTTPEDQDVKKGINNNTNYNLVWQGKNEISPIDIPYIIPEVNYKVPNYTIKADLSNIKNMDSFSGFTNEQLNKIVDNGFVVLPSNSNNAFLKMNTIYEVNEYKGIPNFVTVDSVMHVYHNFFNSSLKILERDRLYGELIKLTNSMLEKTVYLYNDNSYEPIKEDLKFNVIFFAVAKKLLTNEYGALPEELKVIADEEVANILKADGYKKSALLAPRDIDYSQYKVRGHYTNDDKLESYFRAMMWYGQIALPLTEVVNEEEVLCEDETVKALIITYTAFMQSNNDNDLKSWDKIYMPTNFYVGQSDDLNLFQYKDLILNVFGENVNLNDFRNEKYHDKLLEEAKKMPDPGIKNKITLQNVHVGKQFRFMGQRYTFDGEILQELMEPYKRPVPSGLDVAAVLGSKRAKTLLDKYYEPQKTWPEYENKFKAMKEKISKVDDKDWKSNMYNGWLDTISSIQKPFEDVDGAPMFMKNKAWTDKSISSALGSYAELKHDTILYVKQPVAECGGADFIYHHYVEPNIEVYSKLLWLTEYSSTNLKERGLLSQEFEQISIKIIELLELLRDCSIKELNNEVLSKDIKCKLNTIGGKIDSINYAILNQTGGNELSCSAIIADIATVENSCLEIGTELPNEIYVVIKDGEELYLSRGSVYGYHEFLSDTRLTDDEWQEKLGIIKEQYGEDSIDFYMFNTGEPSPSLPKQPEWVYSFKSKEKNNVECKQQEVNWE